MNTLTIFLISVGLAMDAFAVAITQGAKFHQKLNFALKIAIFFGFFQFIMPVLGWLVGIWFENIINGIDHWLAFIILAVLGVKMIIDDFSGTKQDDNQRFDNKILTALAIATSIDALIVGASFAFLKSPIFLLAISAGVIAFIFSLVGALFGQGLKFLVGEKIKALGGIILIIIGLKILLEHLL
ncbi:MAG: manganese efflux pump MntP family protein [Candidatus Buchananbacteria bacterium]